MAPKSKNEYEDELKKALDFSPSEFADAFERISSTAGEINKVFGQSRERINELKTALADTLPGITRLGGNLEDVSKSITEISDASRRNVIANTKDVEQMYAASKILGDSVGEISNSFMDVGIGISQIPKELEKSINYVQSIGGNTKQVMDSVRNSMGEMNRYQFEGGVQGLTKMAAQASMLRFDMNETFRLADKVLTPEGAIETAAAFQRLGVSAGALADPFALMNQSINDPSGLQDSLVNVAKQFTYFDEKTKTFKINPQGVLTLKEMETQTGVNSKEMAKLGLAAAEADKRISAIGSAGLNIKEEDKQYIANIASMGTGGEYEVKINDQETKKLSELTQGEFDKLIKEQKTGPKTLEEIARKQMSFSQIISSDVGAIKAAVIGGVVTQGDLLKVSESLRTATTSFTGAISRNFADPKMARDTVTESLGNLKELIKDVKGDKMSNSQAFSKALTRLGTQMSKGNAELNEKFKAALTEASTTKGGEGKIKDSLNYLYQETLSKMSNTDKTPNAKNVGNSVVKGNEFESLITGRGTSDVKQAVTEGGSSMMGGNKQTVSYDGKIDVEFKITGDAASGLSPSQKEEMYKAITNAFNAEATKQMMSMNGKPSIGTRASNESYLHVK